MSVPVQTDPKRRLGILFSVPLALSLLFFFVNLATERTDTRLLETQNLSWNVTQLRYLATDANAAERGFLLTGDDSYLLPLKQAKAVFPIQARFCESYARERPDLQPRLQRLLALVRTSFDEADHVLETQRTAGFPAALDLIKSGASETTINRIRGTAFDKIKSGASETTINRIRAAAGDLQ